MTKALADAGTLLLLAKHADAARLADMASHLATLDLASYEAGNAIWKQAKLLKLLGEREAHAAHDAVTALISRTSIVRVDGLDHGEAMHVALEHGIAYYGACYVVAARSLGVPLATEDRRLAGSKLGQKVIGWRQLLGE